ncbi:coproporphyrinogen III oxidase [uncultured Slackia sp.]|uniref:coproporphyrinogen III oxidase n=1 Tax=uncultured Slackia sp. TaxID=665903 RepID=UPI0026DECCE1|nr:coproporphyrinogen III oxidase [uncultured Slackia sp.]
MNRRPIPMKIEIPFTRRCPRGCCHSEHDWDTPRMERYIQAIEREAAANAGQFEDCSIEAIRLEGGCASLAPASCISDLMRTIRRIYHGADNAPITMTASIADISGATMPYFRRARISRFDFMMMSLDTFDFARVNTRDNLRDFPLICECFLHSYANDTLGLVLAYGLESNSIVFRRSLFAALRNNCRHIELTRWTGQGAASDDEAEAQLSEGRKILFNEGFTEYAPLFFAAAGHEDRCIAARAQNGDILSFGLGAETRIDGIQSINTSDIGTYLSHSDDYSLITAEIKPLK